MCKIKHQRGVLSVSAFLTYGLDSRTRKFWVPQSSDGFHSLTLRFSHLQVPGRSTGSIWLALYSFLILKNSSTSLFSWFFFSSRKPSQTGPQLTLLYHLLIESPLMFSNLSGFSTPATDPKCKASKEETQAHLPCQLSSQKSETRHLQPQTITGSF
jgi:hypothetical protein